MWYAIADARALGFALEPPRGTRPVARRRADPACAAREQLPVRPSGEPGHRRRQHRRRSPSRGAGSARSPKNAVVVAPGRLDRSATGTGLSARIAVLHARGLMGVGDSMTHASVIGSTFDGRIVREVRVDEIARPPGDRARDSRQRLDHRCHAASSSTRPIRSQRATCSRTRGPETTSRAEQALR